MKKSLLIILLVIANPSYSCGSDDEDGFIDVSQENNLGVTAETLSEGQFLITLPKKFKEGNALSVTLLVGEYENADPELAVQMLHFTDENHIGLPLFYLSDEMQKNATILASYTIKGTLCYAGSITLTGFDKLEYSRHWREMDIKNLFSRFRN